MNEYYTRKRPRLEDARIPAERNRQSGRRVFLTGFQIVVCVICIAAAFVLKQFGGSYYTIAKAYVGDAFKYSITSNDVVQTFRDIRDKWFPDAAQVFSNGVTASSGGSTSSNASAPSAASGNTSGASTSSSPTVANSGGTTSGAKGGTSSAPAKKTASGTSADSGILGAAGTTASVRLSIYSFLRGGLAPKISSLSAAQAQAAPKTASLSPYHLTIEPVLPVKGRMTSSFGYRVNPITIKKDFHTGVDIAAAAGTPILAAFDGTVEKAGRSADYGNFVLVNNGNGIQTFYGHCLSLLVRQGETVKAGGTIARVGSTGASTGYHLHFEIRIKNISVNPQWTLPAGITHPL